METGVEQARKIAYGVLGKLGTDTVTDREENQEDLGFDDVGTTKRLSFHDKEDVLQDCYLKWQTQQASLLAWLKTHADVPWQRLWASFVHNEGVRYLTRRYRLVEVATEVQEDSAGSYEVTLSDELEVYDLLGNQKMTDVAIRLMAGHTLTEVAESLGMNRRTLYRRVQSIKDALQARQ